MHDQRIQVVLQVLSDARQRMPERDAMPLQFVFGADAGQHQQLRRIDRAASQNHFPLGADIDRLAGLEISDAGCAFAFQQHPGGACIRDHRQIRPIQHRVQIATRHAPSFAVFLRQLVGADAFLAGAAEVIVSYIARFERGLDIHAGQQVWRAQIRHVERSPDAMELGRAAFMIFRLFEERQHIRISPSLVTQCRPVIVVTGMAARIHHRVAGAAAAQGLAARPVQPPVIQIALRFGKVAPVENLAHHHEDDPDRNPDERIVIGGPCLQQAHAHRRIGREAIGQHAAGRTGAHDDVIEFFHFVSSDRQ